MVNSYVDSFKAYFKQAREELAVRICERLFDADGSKNKWWQVGYLMSFQIGLGVYLHNNIISISILLHIIIIVIFKEEIHG